MLEKRPSDIPEHKWKLGKVLVEEAGRGNMTIEQVENEAAEMDRDILNEFKYTPYPDAPQVLREFNAKKDFIKNVKELEKAKETAYNDRDVIQHLQKVSEIDGINISNKHHLQEYLKCYERMNMANEAIICKELLREHEEEITYDKTFWKEEI